MPDEKTSGQHAGPRLRLAAGWAVVTRMPLLQAALACTPAHARARPPALTRPRRLASPVRRRFDAEEATSP
jgi:hypothetical protein